MGTYFTNGASKQDIIDDTLREIKSEPYDIGNGRTVRRLDHSVRGNNLWLLIEILDGEKRSVTVALYKLVGHRSGWGYKPMDESAGPYDYNVPKAWASRLTEPPNEWAAEWRAKAFAPSSRKRGGAQ